MRSTLGPAETLERVGRSTSGTVSHRVDDVRTVVAAGLEPFVVGSPVCGLELDSFSGRFRRSVHVLMPFNLLP